MANSPRAFLVGLYEEYLAEASFLYAQRLSLLDDPKIAWNERGEFEERLEAHIDGLVVGGQLALEVCGRQAAEGDFGELYAAACVFCRQNRQDLVLEILDQLDGEDAEKTSAVAGALKQELPEAWCPDFLTLLAGGNPKLAPVLARAFGYRRVPCGPQLLAALRRCAAAAVPELVWALGRIAYSPAAEVLLDYLRSEEEPVRAAAAVALARIGEPGMIDRCLAEMHSHTWPLVPLGLAGGRSAWAALTELHRTNNSADCVIALGLLGDAASVPDLLRLLEQAAPATPAALALQAITGAGISETAFIPEEVNEDELFEAERAAFRRGQPPVRVDGRPFGSTVTRLSQKPEDWNRWWQTNATRFTPGVRYRNGGLFSPGRLIEMLTAERTPHQLRRYCSEELATRYQNDFGIETDMPVSRQVNRLAEAVTWSQADSTRFQEGEWYFAGHRCA